MICLIFSKLELLLVGAETLKELLSHCVCVFTAVGTLTQEGFWNAQSTVYPPFYIPVS